jgi:DNA-binding NtrC family response regulator
MCGFADSVWTETPTAADSLFLKHVHLLSMQQQERLLQALERVRGAAPRLLASASSALDQLVAKGGFLPELYYRISAHQVRLPPLRERAEDIPGLFNLLLLDVRTEPRMEAPPLPPAAIGALASYSWPGNVRELQSIARSYLLMQDADELVSELGRRSGQMSHAQAQEETDLALKEQVRRAARQLESELILRSLKRHAWNRRRTAETLKISYRSLLYKMKNCNIRAITTAPGGGE